MATKDPIQALCEELLCSICLEQLQDPVTITRCGHNFCRSCLTQCWGRSGAKDKVCCPQCRKGGQRRRSLVPNRQLANVVDIAQKLIHHKGKACWPAEEKKRVCPMHGEPMKLFCKDHGDPICGVCKRSKEHGTHKVIPLEEAFEEYKDLIWSCLETFKEERTKLLASQADTERESQDLLKKTKSEREKTVAEFGQLYQFLKEKEKLLLAQVDEVEKEILKNREEYLARYSRELSSLENLIQEMEEKHPQSANELLQGFGSILERCEQRFGNTMVFSPTLKWKIWDFSDINHFLEGAMNQFRETPKSGFQLKKESIALDPDTAHPKLIISEDYRNVRKGNTFRNLPNYIKRFNLYPYVLGQKEFKVGRHFWEVLVGSEESWGVGVARKSVRRKGHICAPEDGIWEIGKWEGEYKAADLPYNPVLPLSEEPKRIRVTLNCEGGRVAFYDADRATLLYVFPAASFIGEALLPIFYVSRKACVTLSP